MQKPLTEHSPQGTSSQTKAAQGAAPQTESPHLSINMNAESVPACRTKCHTSNISSLDTSMRQ